MTYHGPGHAKISFIVREGRGWSSLLRPDGTAMRRYGCRHTGTQQHGLQ